MIDLGIELKEDGFLGQLIAQAIQRGNELLQEPLSAPHCKDILEVLSGNLTIARYRVFQKWNRIQTLLIHSESVH